MPALSLDSISTEILLDVFHASLSDTGFVDTVSYRVDHEGWIEKLNELEQRQYLKREGGSYRVHFVALTVLDDRRVAEERERCERVYSILRNHYKNPATRKREKRLKDLSEELGLSYEQTTQTMRYLMDASSLWNGGSNSFDDPESAYIKPGESIITCKNFGDLVAKVQNWFLPSSHQAASNNQILASLSFWGNPKPQHTRNDLNPCPVVTSYLYELNSDAVARVVGRVGLTVDWELTKEEAYSEKTRIRTYRPRIETVLQDLDESKRMLVVRNLVHELILEVPEKLDLLNDALGRIGWQVADGELTTHDLNIREAFFPSGAEHAAYVQIRSILGRANCSIDIVDPYLDGTIFTMLKAQLGSKRSIRLLTSKVPPDFNLEATKFKNEAPGITLEIRTTRDFHDRFIVLDGTYCFHVGASIKDAGKKACMISQLEDGAIVSSLISFTKEQWKQAIRLL